MNWFTKNVLLLHLVALVVLLGWIHGGTRADLLMPVIPWVAGLCLEWLLVFPQAKRDETLLDCRERVWRKLKRDPLTWVSLALLVLLAIPLMNVRPEPVCDPATGAWTNAPAPIPWLPSCVDPAVHDGVLLWFAAGLIAMLAAKHGLLKRGKRLLLEAICWNGAALALLGFAELAVGTDKLLWLTPMPGYFFSAFGYPNVAGAYFTLIAGLSFGIWLQDVSERSNLAYVLTEEGSDEERSFCAIHRMLAPTILCFAAAIATLSRAAILLSVLLAFVLTAYALRYVWDRIQKATRVTLVATVGAVILSLTALFFTLRLESLKKEVRTITWSAITERVTGRGYYHARVAKAIFRDYPAFGVGGWGYPAYQAQYTTDEDNKHLQIVGGANVHNDSLQFLAEHGIVGYGLMLAIILLLAAGLIVPAVRFCRLKNVPVKTVTHDKGDGWLYRIPPPVVAVFASTAATICHSFGDLPFRAPSVLTVWLLAYVCALGWLPVVHRQHSSESEQEPEPEPTK